MSRLILIIIIALSAGAQANLKGPEVAKKIYNSNRGKDSVQSITMTLIDKSNNKKVRKFTLLGITNNKYDSKSMIHFSEPRKVKGTSMLTVNHKGDSTDQWLFLPALKKTRRISGSRKSGRFVGSDLVYEDLEDREVTLDNHTVLGMVKTKNGQYLKLQSVPKDSSSSMYSKYVALIDPKKWIAVKVEYYKGNKLHKVLSVKSIKKIDGNWTAMKSELKDLSLNHRTVLEVNKVKYGVGLNNTIFNRKYLENSKRLKKYLK